MQDTPLDTIITNIVFPNWLLFALGWMIFELIISVSLIFGLLTQLGFVIGAGSTITLGLGALGVDWPWTYVLLFIGFVTCALTGAERWYGIDYWLKDKIPEKLAYFLI